jgi:hypothetical protein
MRVLELARLEAAQAALWPRAMQGHVPSVKALLRILDLECRLQGLYEPAAKPGPKDHWDHCEGPPIVVISPDDCRTVAAPPMAALRSRRPPLRRPSASPRPEAGTLALSPAWT